MVFLWCFCGGVFEVVFWLCFCGVFVVVFSNIAQSSTEVMCLCVAGVGLVCWWCGVDFGRIAEKL